MSFRALDAAATRRSIRRRIIAIVVALVVGLAAVTWGIAIWRAARQVDPIQANGVRITATVTDVRLATSGQSGPPSVSIVITFTAGGETRVGTVDAGRDANAYHSGDSVDIVYPAADPSRFELAGKPPDSSPLPWFVAAGFGVVVLTLAAYGIRRTSWAVHVLRRSPWVVVQSRVVEVPFGTPSRFVTRVVVLRGAPDDGQTFAAPVAWRSHALAGMEAEAWVAGSDRRFLIAPAGGGPLLRAKRVKLTNVGIAFDDDILHSRLDAEG